MFNIRKKFSFKKIYMLIISLFMVFNIITPNFVSAEETLICKPINIKYDVNKSEIYSYELGEIISEDTWWLEGQNPSFKVFLETKTGELFIDILPRTFFNISFKDIFQGFKEGNILYCYDLSRIANWLRANDIAIIRSRGIGDKSPAVLKVYTTVTELYDEFSFCKAKNTKEICLATIELNLKS